MTIFTVSCKHFLKISSAARKLELIHIKSFSHTSALILPGINLISLATRLMKYWCLDDIRI